MEHLLKNLTQMVMALDRPDIQIADALLTKMLDDQVGGRMLARLLYWFPKAVKVGGWVYKSWRDWNAECALSSAQVKRVHHIRLLEHVGISRKLMKANGAPTTHYRLDMPQFLSKVAAFLGLTLEYITLTARVWWLACKQQLELQLDPATFTRFIRQTDFVAFEPQTNCWTLQVPNEMVRHQLQHRLYRDVRQFLSHLTGLDCQLVFEVHPQRS